MKKRLVLLILFASFGFSFGASAQPLMSARDMVSIRPMTPSEVDNLPKEARAALNNKLNQMVAQNGFGATSSQFVLTANLVLTDKQVTATAPANFVVKYEASFYVVDLLDKTILNEVSVSLTGVDRLENRAIVQAVNQINPKSSAIRAFMNNTRTKIVDYYNTRIPSLLTKAQGLADRNEYTAALEILSAIPETVDQYPMVSEQMTAIYEKKIDRDASSALQAARGKMATHEYDEAIEALMKVDPASTRASEALALIAQLQERLDAEELRCYEDWKKLQANEMELERHRIDAARAVGVEQAKADAARPNNPMQGELDHWFLITFNMR